MKFSKRLRCAAVAAAAFLYYTHVHAGLTLDQAIARDRTLRSVDEFALLPAPADGGVLAIGGPPNDVPYLLTPLVRERGGARVVRSVWAQPDGLQLKLGVNAYDGAKPEGVLEGSSLSMPLWVGDIYASVETRHWGPGWVGNLILDAGAPAVPAIGWRKATSAPFETSWLSWLGPWNADVFIGRLAGQTPRRPLLVGMRMQVRPLPGLEIGASRTLQWGGKGRNESVRTFLRALLGLDNVDDPNTEPGNQLAGFDARYSFTMGDVQAAVYVQAIGEDEAGLMPSQWMSQLGADWATQWGDSNVRLYVEASDLVAGDLTGHPRPGSAYRHHIYPQGYTNRGAPLGHPIGGDAKLASAGTVVDRGPLAWTLGLHAGRTYDRAQRFTPGLSLAGVNAAASHEVPNAGRIGLSLWHWRAGSEHSSAVQAWWQTAWQ